MTLLPRGLVRVAALCLLLPALASAEPAGGLGASLPPLLAEHPGRTGVYVLERGEDALLARAWLADHADRSIDVQYFIWSTDNVGLLAAEALLRAADRGVRVRVLVDDLLVDAPPESLLALVAHPSIDIRIYNPKHKVGTSWAGRLRNVATDFRAVNQRMHDKTAIFDGLGAITGGRNMADEYFDFDHEYNFRDRDVLLLGPAAKDAAASFERFWRSGLAAPAEDLLRKKHLSPERVQTIYDWLRAYARDPANFAPEVREAVANLPRRFGELLNGLAWEPVRFLCDLPGKNDGTKGLRGGGETTRELVRVLQGARRRVTIQSPYLILPSGGPELFRDLARRGVEVRIVTNSLAATDNLQAFSGYRKQRRELLDAGVRLREFRPDPAVRRELLARHPRGGRRDPVFALHAKTLVVDGETLFVGTFNLDPRSANLNTEVGALVVSARLAGEVERRIEADMAPGNSWDPAVEDPDTRAGAAKRLRAGLWALLPLDPIL